MSNMNLSNITDEQLMWEAKKRFAIPIYFNKKQAEKQLSEMDDDWWDMSNDEWDNFKDDFNNQDEEITEEDFDKIGFAGVAYFRFWDGTRADPEEEVKEPEKKPKKKKKHKRLVIVPNKLCKSTECKLIKDEEWNMKCAVCDGYYKDDGLHDILDVNDDENCFCHLCGQGGIKSKNLVIMKDTGSVTCRAACLEDDFCECDVCGEELHEDESFRQLYGSNSMTFCKECYADRL